jgi:hypothetical protein
MSKENSNEQTELTSDESALLELTNDVGGGDGEAGLESRQPLVLTTKNAYLWAIVVAQIFEANSEL